MARVRKIILIVIINIVLFYLLAEILLIVLGLPKEYGQHTFPPQFKRVTNNEILYVNLPSTTISFQYPSSPRKYFNSKNEVEHHTNKFGFRGVEFELVKPTNTFRVVVLGDSFTFGEGVKDEDIFTSKLKDLLSENIQYKNNNIEVINLGVGGYNTQQEWTLLKNFASQLNPDFIILQYTLNDAEPQLFYALGDKLKRRPREADYPMNFSFSNSPPYFVKISRLNKLIWQIYYARQTNNKLINFYLSLYEESNKDWKKTKGAFTNIKKYSQANNTPVLVVIFPLLYQLNDNYPFFTAHKKISEEAKKNNLDFLDLFPILKNKKDQELWVYPTDQHPNELVHKLAADEIARYINQRK